MKARLVKTSFWSDERVEGLSPEATYIFLYLITNAYIGLTGAYKLSNKRASFETGCPIDTLLKGYEELEKAKFIVVKDGWIVVLNTEKHNNYSGGSKTSIAYDKEFNQLPRWIKDTLLIGYAYTQKTENINKKTENRKQKSSSTTNVSSKTTETYKETFLSKEEAQRKTAELKQKVRSL